LAVRCRLVLRIRHVPAPTNGQGVARPCDAAPPARCGERTRVRRLARPHSGHLSGLISVGSLKNTGPGPAAFALMRARASSFNDQSASRFRRNTFSVARCPRPEIAREEPREITSKRGKPPTQMKEWLGTTRADQTPALGLRPPSHEREGRSAREPNSVERAATRCFPGDSRFLDGQ
jgi:hypothetical protein